MKKLNNFKYYIPVYLVRQALPLVSAPIFTRLLSVEEFGILALAIFFATFISGISNFGLLTIFQRNFFSYDNIFQIKNLLFSTITFVFCLLILLLCLLSFFGEFIVDNIFQKTIDIQILILSSIYMGIKTLNQFFFTFYKNNLDGKWYSIVSVLEGLLVLTIPLVLLTRVQNKIEFYVVGLIFSNIIIFILFIYKTFNNSLPKFIFQDLKKALILGLPLTPTFFFGVLNTQFDRYMLGMLNNLSGAGIFDIGQKIANTSFSFTSTLQNIFEPEIYKKMFSNKQNQKNSIGDYLLPFFFLSSVFSFFLIIFSVDLVYFLLPKEYSKSSTVISLLSFLYLIYFFGKIPQLLFVKKTKIITILSVISIGLNIILNFFLIKTYGFIGATYGTLISGTLSTLIRFIYSQKYYYIKWRVDYLIIVLIVLTITVVNILLTDINKDFNLSYLFIKSGVFLMYVFLGIKKLKINLSSYLNTSSNSFV